MLVLATIAVMLPIVAFLHSDKAVAQGAETPIPATGAPDVGPPPTPAADPRVFGKWRIVCAAGEACRLSQSIVTATSNKPVLIARAYRAEKDPVLVLTFPLGVFLSRGVTLIIDATKPDRLPFETCDMSGCHLGIRLTSKLLERLRKAKTMTTTIYDGARKPASLKLELDGFISGLAELGK